jgi:nucleoside phosphorylase
MIDARDYLLKVAKLKGLMNDRAWGGQPLERDYAQAREVLVTSPIRNALPNIVLTCHNLQEWWQFIKGKYSTYKERTEFLQTEFAPLLASLEQNVMPLSTPLPSAPPRPDVVLVTVNQHETRAVHDAFLAATGNEGKPVSLGGRSYHDLGRIGTTTVYHAISEMGSGGSGGMQQTVEKAISNLEPGAIIAVGIAFGANEKEQQIGDILVSKLLRLYEQQRVGKKGNLTLRGALPDASPRLISHFRTFQQTKWAGATVRFGVVLTGEKLIDNVDFREQLVKIESEAVGGEMEGAGLYVSSYDNKVDWIVVKAICDWADGDKGVEKEERQKLAAKNSTEFVVESLKYASLLHPGGGTRHHP